MSRIVQFEKCGGPEVLEIIDADIPMPGPDEIRIRVKALGLNRAESMWRMGAYVEAVTLPARLGYEAAGIVDAVGSGVTGFAVGDAVNTVPAFSMNHYGMYGEVVLAPASAVVKHPPSLSFEEAASIWMMFVTVYGAFINQADLEAGDVVLIPAASSSVGLAAIQMANMVGATPIALTRSSEKREQLLAAGAAHVIVTEEEDVEAEVQRITEGRGADVVFDPVGGPLLAKLIRAMAPGGMLLIYGALSTETTPLPMLDVLIKLPIIRGYTIWETSSNPASLKTAAAFILKGLASGALKPVIDKVFSFDDIVEAHRYMESNRQFGKIVVTV